MATKKRKTSWKSDSTSPKVFTKPVLITTAIHASENRHVKIVDAPGAFLTTDMDEEVIIVLEGDFSDITEEISPITYRKYASIINNVSNIPYAQIKKAL